MHESHTIIETLYNDRRLTVRSDGQFIELRRTAGGEPVYAYLTPRGMRQLIDVLEPHAAPPAPDPLPPIDVAAVLDALLPPADPAEWVVCYTAVDSGRSRRSANEYAQGGPFTRAEAERARRLSDLYLGDNMGYHVRRNSEVS